MYSYSARVAIAAFAALLLCANAALGGDDAATRQEFHATFQRMLANPSDVKLTMRYAKLATDLGDYESAIPPLERLLMYNPDLPKVRLEVGVLYYLLNSHTMAKKYLSEVKADAHAKPEHVKRAASYLAKMKM